MRRRHFSVIWPALFITSTTIFLWLMLSAQKFNPTPTGKDSQEDYVDRRGIRVVVGHYVGDVGTAGHPINLTDEILNANNFDPKPNEGHNGLPVILGPRELARSYTLYSINKFNLLASDRIPLNRSLPDVRKKRCLTKYKETDSSDLPKTSVIIVFHNEAWSTLLRTIHSVINRSPETMLEEILLVDDASTRTFLGADLDKTVSMLKVPTKVLRTKKREGLVRARLIGAKAAKGQVLTFLDAHCEVTKGWLEPLLMRVAENRTHVVCPVIDIINDDTFAYVRSFELHWGAFNWNLHFRWYTLGISEIRKRKLDIAEPFATPAMAGGLFAIDKEYFFEIGAYDEQMEIWGGENLELSFRVWQCGGAVEIAPCSHVGHLFRKSSPYSFPGGVGDVLYANLARVALVWMDTWADFYFKFNEDAARQRDHQSVRERMRLRAQLKCHDFAWYLNNVWPHHFFPNHDRFFGQIKLMNGEEDCVTRPQTGMSLNQPSGPVSVTRCTKQLSHMFVMTKAGHIMTDESVCLDAPDFTSEQPRVKVQACSFSHRQTWHYDKQIHTILHLESDKCLQVHGKTLILAQCSSTLDQKFELNAVRWS